MAYTPSLEVAKEKASSMAAPTTEMEQLAVNDNGNAGNKPAKAKTDKSKADKPKPGKSK